MFPPDILTAYLLAALLVVVAPGPDNLLAMSRGMSPGWQAAALSATGAGLGIMAHTIAATFGLTLILRTSPMAFWMVKAAGGAYLLWLGYQAIVSHRLIAFAAGQHLPLGRVFLTGLLSNLLNPKPGLFVVAFIPQFVSDSRGSVAAQMLGYGALFALLTALAFSIMGPGRQASRTGWRSGHGRWWRQTVAPGLPSSLPDCPSSRWTTASKAFAPSLRVAPQAPKTERPRCPPAAKFAYNKLK